ncbi:MAG: hypothetical protein PHV37_05675 [Candidatus Gastranaerophilales bacterium]|nr:hypothetical protein [Candidatus Gastranaerophilales bacterium]
MTDTLKLTAEKRNMDKNPRQLRSEGFLTGTIYGKDMESVSIQLNARDFANTYKKNPSAKFEVAVDKKTYATEVANVQMNYATSEQLNVEFKAV